MQELIKVEFGRIAQDLQLKRKQVENVAQLLDEGNSVPFITRYRKELTGDLDEEQIREIQRRVQSLRQLAERRQTIERALETQGKLTPELKAALDAALSMKRLEDLYLPYKPKKQTLATVARDRGLGPFAEAIWRNDEMVRNLEELLPTMIDADKQLNTPEDIMTGAQHILAEMIAENADVRESARNVLWDGKISAARAENAPADADAEFRNYFEYAEPLMQIPPHRVMALNRGEKVGVLKIRFDYDRARLQEAALARLPLEGHAHRDFLAHCAADALDRLLLRSLEREARGELTNFAEDQAVRVFARNVRTLILQSPVRGRRVLAIDPGYRNGCKFAVLDEFGNPLTHGVVYPYPRKKKKKKKKVKFAEIDHSVAANFGEGLPIEGADAPATQGSAAAGTLAPGQEDLPTVDGQPVGEVPVSALVEGGSTAAPLADHLMKEGMVNEGGPTTVPPVTETSPASQGQSEEPPTSLPAESVYRDVDPPAGGSPAPATQGSAAAGSATPTVNDVPTVDGKPVGGLPPGAYDQEAPDAPTPADQRMKEGMVSEGGPAAPPPVTESSPASQGASDDTPASRPADAVYRDTDEEENRDQGWTDASIAASGEATGGDSPTGAGTGSGAAAGAAPGEQESPDDEEDDDETDEEDDDSEEAVAFEAEPAEDAPARDTRIIWPAEAGIVIPPPGVAEEGDVPKAIKPRRQRPERGERKHKLPASAAVAEAGAPAPPADPNVTRREQAKRALAKICRTHNVNAIAIGNGAGCRETEELIAELIADQLPGVEYVIVNEAGASFYSTSPIGREEFPDFDATLRGAISIGRRLQDPLSELVKIDPENIGVGLYQHDLNPKLLKETLHDVVESCVNYVGVDVNTASIPLLQYVSGFNQLRARNVVEHRKANGPFKNREQIKDVAGIGPAVFTQAAGFLKITDGDQPLDQTWIHPESYAATQQLLESLAAAVTILNDREALTELQTKLREQNPLELAEKLQVGEPTVRDILEQLGRPGRDPREDLPTPIFKTGILKLEDLVEGMELKGTVLNVVDFGVFVDIGLKDSGLVHISQLADRFVRNPHEVAAVGDVVNVWVLSVDRERRRVSLTMIKPGAIRRPPRRPRRGGPQGEQHPQVEGAIAATGEAGTQTGGQPQQQRGGRGDGRGQQGQGGQGQGQGQGRGRGQGQGQGQGRRPPYKPRPPQQGVEGGAPAQAGDQPQQPPQPQQPAAQQQQRRGGPPPKRPPQGGGGGGGYGGGGGGRGGSRLQGRQLPKQHRQQPADIESRNKEKKKGAGGTSGSGGNDVLKSFGDLKNLFQKKDEPPKTGDKEGSAE